MRPADQFLAKGYEAQAEAFNKKQSRIKGSFDPQAGNDYAGWLAKLTTLLASDTPPDCFLVQQDMLPGLASTNSLLTLDPHLSRDAREVDAADFNPSHLEAGKWRGKQVGLTPDGCAVLEYYNLTLFQESGVPAPRPTWTWNDYLDAARRLTKGSGAAMTQAGIGQGTMPTAGNLWPWLWSNNADLFSADFKTVRIAERPAQDALQFAVDLVQRHGVSTASPGVALPASAAQEGKVAMWRANRGFLGNLSSGSAAFKVNVVPLPRSPQAGLSTTVTTPGHIAIARANKRPDAAWEWLKYLTGKEAQIIRSEVTGSGCPSRKSAAAHPSYKDFTSPQLDSPAANKTFADVLADPKGARFVPPYIRVNDAVAIATKHATAAVRGEVAVPAALESARRELEELLRQFPQPES
jgi:multiple sugar transport system substrate-binding protein